MQQAKSTPTTMSVFRVTAGEIRRHEAGHRARHRKWASATVRVGFGRRPIFPKRCSRHTPAAGKQVSGTSSSPALRFSLRKPHETGPHWSVTHPLFWEENQKTFRGRLAGRRARSEAGSSGRRQRLSGWPVIQPPLLRPMVLASCSCCLWQRTRTTLRG